MGVVAFLGAPKSKSKPAFSRVLSLTLGFSTSDSDQLSISLTGFAFNTTRFGVGYTSAATSGELCTELDLPLLAFSRPFFGVGSHPTSEPLITELGLP